MIKHDKAGESWRCWRNCSSILPGGQAQRLPEGFTKVLGQNSHSMCLADSSNFQHGKAQLHRHNQEPYNVAGKWYGYVWFSIDFLHQNISKCKFLIPFLDDSWSLSRLLITSWVMIIHDDRDRRRQYHCLHHQNARARCCWSFAALLWTDTVKYLLQSVG